MFGIDTNQYISAIYRNGGGAIKLYVNDSTEKNNICINHHI